MIRTVLPLLVAAFLVASLIWGPRRAWAAWKRFGQAIGDTLARLVMTVFYFTILVPFALISRVKQDPLSQKGSAAELWQPHPSDPATDLAAAARQY